MDAVEFLKKEKRMCERYKNKCKDCPVSSEKSGEKLPCYALRMHNPERYCSIVKKWGDEHPANTRQSELLKMFPKVDMSEGVISIPPCVIDIDYRSKKCPETDCFSCWKKYWLTEVE